VLCKANSGTRRQCGFEDSRKQDGDRRGLRLREIARVRKLAMQIYEQKVMSQSAKKGCASLTAFFIVREQTDLRRGNL
jgi:hypothetical protein